MAWIDVIKRLLPTDSNHADNFNAATTEIEGNLNELKSLKANKTQEPWITPTLLNGWVDFEGSYATAQYFKDEFGMVHIKGLIKFGVITPNTPIFNLPVGYHPILTHIVCSVISFDGTNSYAGDIIMQTDGSVVIDKGIKNTWLSLNIPPYRI